MQARKGHRPQSLMASFALKVRKEGLVSSGFFSCLFLFARKGHRWMYEARFLFFFLFFFFLQICPETCSDNYGEPPQFFFRFCFCFPLGFHRMDIPLFF
jgi:hypothetical protein